MRTVLTTAGEGLQSRTKALISPTFCCRKDSAGLAFFDISPRNLG